MPDPWLSFLRELDAMATEHIDFHCIGGFVITQKYGFASRQTEDLDVLSIVPLSGNEELLTASAEGSALHQKYGVYLDYVTVIQCYPEDYQDRLTEMYPGLLKNIRLLAVEAHDLALMKLERHSARDRDDVIHLAESALITTEELKRRYVKEMRPYVPLPATTDLTISIWTEIVDEVLERRAKSKSPESA